MNVTAYNKLYDNLMESYKTYGASNETRPVENFDTEEKSSDSSKTSFSEDAAVMTLSSQAVTLSNVNSSNVGELAGKSFSSSLSQSNGQSYTYTFTDSSVSSFNITGGKLNISIGVGSGSNLDSSAEILARVKALARQGASQMQSGTLTETARPADLENFDIAV